MRRVRAYDRRQDPALSQEEQQSRAYLLIEEARLRCEQVGNAASDGWLLDLHRELGLAGLCASSNLQAWPRRILLEAARARSESPIRGADTETTIELTLGMARTAVEHCLSVPEHVEHMREAHAHLRAARDLLGFHRFDRAADLD